GGDRPASDRLEGDRKGSGSRSQRRIGRVRIIRVGRGNSDRVGGGRADQVPVGVHGVDRDGESGAGNLIGGRAGLARGGARSGGFTRHQQLHLHKSAGVHRDGRAGVGALAAVGVVRGRSRRGPRGVQGDAESVCTRSQGGGGGGQCGVGVGC